jgi:hypothetical protein
MDNFHIDITYEGKEALAQALQLAFRGHTAIGYTSDITHLVFYWVKPDGGNDKYYQPLPFKIDAKFAAEFASKWLEFVSYPAEPDHDGDNGKGWRVYTEAWGKVDNQYQAIVGVKPCWALYGK